MTTRSSHKGSIFPASGNENADRAWAALILQRDLELFWHDDEEYLFQTLHAITGKPINTDAELGYVIDLIRGPPHRKR